MARTFSTISLIRSEFQYHLYLKCQGRVFYLIIMKIHLKIVKKNFLVNHQVTSPFFHFKWIYRFFKIHINVFSFFHVYKKTLKNEAITVQVQYPGKFLDVIRNLVTKTYSKFVTLRSVFQIYKKKKIKNVKKMKNFRIENR